MDIAIVKEKLDGIMTRFEVPGYNVCLQKDGLISHLSGGFADVDRQIPTNSDTVYAIASCTKSFVSGTLCILADRGQLDLDDPVRRYIPEFEMMDSNLSHQITIRDILSHRSGLQRHDFAWYAAMANLTEADIIRKLRHLPNRHAIRYKWQYNNMMFMMAADIITRVSGMHWQDVIRREIFTPLEMNSACFSPSQAQEACDASEGRSFSKPYLKDPKTGERKELPYADCSGVGGGGTMHMSATDLAKWAQLLLSGGAWQGRQIISYEHVRQMTSPQMPKGEPLSPVLEGVVSNQAYGLGLATEVYRGTQVIYHSGHIDGFMSYVFALPQFNVCCAITTNLGVSQASSAMYYQILDEILGVDSDWCSALFEHQQKQKQELAQKASKLEDAKPKDAPCPLPLAELSGTYRHPGYGDIEVEAAGEGLLLHMGNFTLEAKHYAYHHFFFEEPNLLPGMRFELSFIINYSGEVHGLSAALDFDTNEHARFTRIDN